MAKLQTIKGNQLSTTSVWNMAASW